eukprot:scaffold28361_cov51-Attheya_sp.AAC.1
MSSNKAGKVSAGSTVSAAVRQSQALLQNQKTAAQEAFKSRKLEPTEAALNLINAHLAEGIVLPEYHAYITGAPTYSTMDPPIPSSNVEAGGEPMERVVNVIQDGEAMSKLVVDGTPCLKFTEDHNMVWHYNVQQESLRSSCQADFDTFQYDWTCWCDESLEPTRKSWHCGQGFDWKVAGDLRNGGLPRYWEIVVTALRTTARVFVRRGECMSLCVQEYQCLSDFAPRKQNIRVVQKAPG